MCEYMCFCMCTRLGINVPWGFPKHPVIIALFIITIQHDCVFALSSGERGNCLCCFLCLSMLRQADVDQTLCRPAHLCSCTQAHLWACRSLHPQCLPFLSLRERTVRPARLTDAPGPEFSTFFIPNTEERSTHSPSNNLLQYALFLKLTSNYDI